MTTGSLRTEPAALLGRGCRGARAAIFAVSLAASTVGQLAGDIPTPEIAALPLVFVENQGQWNASVPFLSRFGRAVVRPEASSVTVVVGERDADGTARGQVVRFELERAVAPEGIERVPGLFNFLVGQDHSAWRAGVLGYQGVLYRNVRPGVSLELRGYGARIDWTLRVEEGADCNGFGLHVDGVDGVDARANGGAVLRTSVHDVLFGPPDASGPAESGKARVSVTARWLSVNHDILLDLENADGSATGGFILNWSTYLGGSLGDNIWDAKFTPNGLVAAGGYTVSTDYPVTPGAFQESKLSPFPWGTGVVTLLDPEAQQLVYSTYLGGTGGGDFVHRLAVLENGNTVVTGQIGSHDFPVTNGAFDKTFVTGSKAFIAQLDSGGADLVFSTYLGGNDTEITTVEALVLTTDGTIVVAGTTSSKEFPTSPGAFQPQAADTFSGVTDGFITEVAPLGTNILHSTYLGGAGEETDRLKGLAIDDDGSVIVIGHTKSAAFPITPGSYDTTFGGGSWDAFITRLSPDLGTLEFSTYLGSTKSDEGWSVAVAADGSLILAGRTDSPDFPITPGAFDQTLNEAADVFVTRLDPTGSSILASTFLGGTADEGCPCPLRVDSADSVTVAGHAFSFLFPVTPGAYQEDKLSVSTDPDAFISRFHPNGKSLLYSTFLGGSKSELSTFSRMGLDTNHLGDAVLAVLTASTDFPTTPGSYSPTSNGNADGTLTFLTMLPKGASRYGTSSPGPNGPLAIGTLSMPQVGNDGFGITVTAAPKQSHGWLLISLGSLSSSVPLAGAELWVNPSQLIALASLGSDALGWSEVRIAIPDDPSLTDFHAYVQAVWPQVGAPAAATAALELVVQP